LTPLVADPPSVAGHAKLSVVQAVGWAYVAPVREDGWLRRRLADGVRVLRRRRKWTQEQAAEECGVSIRNYQAIEGATHDARLDTLEALCEGFDCEPAELFRRPRISRR
jgi:DNA-binding Xre family transcriptional regulator